MEINFRLVHSTFLGYFLLNDNEGLYQKNFTKNLKYTRNNTGGVSPNPIHKNRGWRNVVCQLLGAPPPLRAARALTFVMIYRWLKEIGPYAIFTV